MTTWTNKNQDICPVTFGLLPLPARSENSFYSLIEAAAMTRTATLGKKPPENKLDRLIVGPLMLRLFLNLLS
jgi:hypothetical protein